MGYQDGAGNWHEGNPGAPITATSYQKTSGLPTDPTYSGGTPGGPDAASVGSSLMNNLLDKRGVSGTNVPPPPPPPSVVSGTHAEDQFVQDSNTLGQITGGRKTYADGSYQNQGAVGDQYLRYDANGDRIGYGKGPEAQTKDGTGDDTSSVGSAITALATQSQAEYDAAQTKLGNLQAQADQYNADLIKSIQADFASRKASMEQLNRGLVGSTTQAGIRAGRNIYAPEMEMQLITSAEADGIQRLSALDAQEKSLILQAQMAKSDKDFERLSASIDLIKSNQEQKRQAIMDLHQLQMDNDRELRDKAAARREQIKFQRDTASDTVAALAKAGADLTPDDAAYYGKVFDMSPDAFAKYYDVTKGEMADLKGAAALDQHAKLMAVLNDVPAGTPIDINGHTYYGMRGMGDLQIDGQGNGTIATVDQSTGKVVVKDVGFVGTPKDGWELYVAPNGLAWNHNKTTGQLVPIVNPGTNSADHASADWTSILPNGAVYTPADGRDTTGQCGVLVNDMTGIGFGDTIESKTSKIDKTIGTAANPLKIGDAVVINAGTHGHVAVVNSIVAGPDGKTYLKLTESNMKKNAQGQGVIDNTRTIAADDPTVLGFARGTLNPALATGPSVGGQLNVGVTANGDLKEVDGKLYNVVNGVATPVLGPDGKQLAGSTSGGTLKEIGGVLYSVNGTTATPVTGADGKPLTTAASSAAADLLVKPIPPEKLKDFGISNDRVGITWAQAQSEGLLKPTDIAVEAQTQLVDNFAKRYATAQTEAERKSVADQAKDAGVDAQTLIAAASKVPANKGEIVSVTTNLPANVSDVTTKAINTAQVIGSDLAPRALEILTNHPELKTGLYANTIITKLPKEFRTDVQDQITNIASQMQSQYFFLVSGAQVSPQEELRLKQAVPGVDATVSQNIQRIKDFKTTMYDIVGRELRSRGLTITGDTIHVKEKSSGQTGTIPLSEFSSSEYEITE